MVLTNKDKYLKDGVDIEEFIRDITDNIGIVVTTSDITKPIGISIYADDFKKFLNTALKPTLTEDEKVILRNIDKEYAYIERVNDGTLRVNDKSTSEQIIWRSTYPHNHLFQFIKPRRRI